MNASHFRERRQEVITPGWVLRLCAAKWGEFDFDPCPVAAKRKGFDGLDTRRPWGRNNWVNPPYDTMDQWITRAIGEAKNGRPSCMLIPFRTQMPYWYALVVANGFATYPFMRYLQFQGYESGFAFPMVVVRVEFSETPVPVADRSLDVSIWRPIDVARSFGASTRVGDEDHEWPSAFVRVHRNGRFTLQTISHPLPKPHKRSGFNPYGTVIR